VFGFGRRKTRSQLMRDELSEGFDHLMQAATHAAGGVGATVGPRVNAARDYVSPTTERVRGAASQGWGTTVTALAPLAVAARQGAAQAGATARNAKPKSLKAIRMKKKEPKMSRKRGAMLAVLLTAGAAAGAAGALVMRRRKQQRWEEYDPNQALESTNMRTQTVANSARSTFDSAVDSAATGAQRIAAGVDRATDKITSGTDKAGDKASDKASTATANAAKNRPGPASNKADGVISGSPSRNSHS
jgi:hypothetical protein